MKQNREPEPNRVQIALIISAMVNVLLILNVLEGWKALVNIILLALIIIVTLTKTREVKQ